MSLLSREESLKEAYQSAIQIMKDKSKSFYHAFSRLPKERFLAVCALYAFCRYCDDIVDLPDETVSQAEKKDTLKKLSAALDELYEEGATEESSVLAQRWWPAFVDTVEQFDIPKEPLMMQIRGQQMDNDFTDIETLDDLINYSKHVAGSVGTMLLPVLTAESAILEEDDFIADCESLGVAMQITNILRDVGEDNRLRDRVYLPKDLMKKNGVRRETLSRLANADTSSEGIAVPRNFVDLWEELAAVSHNLYQRFIKWLPYFVPESRIPLVTAALNYQAIEDEVRSADYDCFTRRNYTSELTRGTLVLKAKSIVKEQQTKKGD